MLNKITSKLKEIIINYPKKDQIYLKGKLFEINTENFSKITSNSGKTIAFIDGGEAEIITAANFNLSFIRIFAQVYQNLKKIESKKIEFFILTTVKFTDKLYFESKIFSNTPVPINEEMLNIESTEDDSITKIPQMARRFTELLLSFEINADFIILDGILDPSFKNEEKILNTLPSNVCSLAKTSTLITKSGNNPNLLLNKLSPYKIWRYHVSNNTYFIKLNDKSKHVFRFDGNKEALNYLLDQSSDSIFPGYPYGLIYVDKHARISNQEKKSIKLRILLKKENQDIINYLSTTNAHDILDSI